MTRLIAAIVYCAAVLPAASAAQSDTTGLGAIVHQIVVESLTGGGTRPDQSFFAWDSASAALLNIARVPTVAGPAPAGLLCPRKYNKGCATGGAASRLRSEYRAECRRGFDRATD